MCFYALGFAFNEDRDCVLLIEKRRPYWQAGKLNGIGGEAGFDESTNDAMVRKFKEETGLETRADDWDLFGRIVCDDCEVHLFRSFTDKIYSARQTTDEALVIVQVQGLQGLYWAMLPDVPALISAAIDPQPQRITLMDYRGGRASDSAQSWNHRGQPPAHSYREEACGGH